MKREDLLELADEYALSVIQNHTRYPVDGIFHKELANAFMNFYLEATAKNEASVSGNRGDLMALKEFTKKCRHDMHEPDEQGISAKVIGTKLDNAFGCSGMCDEIVVILNDSINQLFMKVNLADLIAWARR